MGLDEMLRSRNRSSKDVYCRVNRSRGVVGMMKKRNWHE